MKKALFIVGPTASGKTQLGIEIAQKFNGAIASADSVQVYKGLDIVSGKDITGKFQISPIRQAQGKNFKFQIDNKNFSFGYYLVSGVKVYLLDLVSPEYSFNVFDYISVAKPTIETLAGQNILPIVVGGTGFYIKALIDGIGTLQIPPDKKLRRLLESKTIEELIPLLKKSDLKKYESMNDSDRKNKRRLIRAVEISQFSFSNYESSDIGKLEDFEVLMIGLHAERETIKRRIDERVEKRIENGAFEEVERVFKNYAKLSSSVKNANGYKQLFEYFMGKVTKDEAVENWRKAEYINAKKQMTWFRKDKRIRWFDITEERFEGKIQDLITKWLKQ